MNFDTHKLRNSTNKHTYSLRPPGELPCGESCPSGILAMLTAVPMARTTMPDSPSRSKFCVYLKLKAESYKEHRLRRIKSMWVHGGGMLFFSNMFLFKFYIVTWCFTPSQPSRLYQGKRFYIILHLFTIIKIHLLGNNSHIQYMCGFWTLNTVV